MNSLEDYKTVLIIGNGFDKNIGMPTSYKEFMGSEEFKDLITKDNSVLAKYLDYKKSHDGTNWIDLEKELGELKTELFKLKFSLATNGLDNPMKIKEVKKDIAKINTVLTERKIAEAKA